MRKKVTDIVVGDSISLDVGYGTPQDEWCKVLKVFNGKSLFGEDQISFLVTNRSYEPDWHTCGFNPENYLDVEDRRVKARQMPANRQKKAV